MSFSAILGSSTLVRITMALGQGFYAWEELNERFEGLPFQLPFPKEVLASPYLHTLMDLFAFEGNDVSVELGLGG